MADVQLRIGACLSLSGRFGQFGRQAAQGLETWRQLGGGADLVIEDDRSDPRALEAILPSVAERCDLLLGPYSTLLMRTAGRIASDAGLLLWNHGGSGDESAWPGHVVSVLTPTTEYAEPFVTRLPGMTPRPALRIAQGAGRFGAQVAGGAETHARETGISVRRYLADGVFEDVPDEDWVLFSAGTFEHDTEIVNCARDLARQPHLVCAVAAGVRAFGQAVHRADGVFGIAQWFPGSSPAAQIGPSEDEFADRYSALWGAPPDYPAVQAAATATIAVHSARLAQSTSPHSLWAAAVTLEASTLFGPFKIDVVSGAQVSHQTVLVKWSDGSPHAC